MRHFPKNPLKYSLDSATRKKLYEMRDRVRKMPGSKCKKTGKTIKLEGCGTHQKETR